MGGQFLLVEAKTSLRDIVVSHMGFILSDLTAKGLITKKGHPCLVTRQVTLVGTYDGDSGFDIKASDKEEDFEYVGDNR